jgi:hypothetical protein
MWTCHRAPKFAVIVSRLAFLVAFKAVPAQVEGGGGGKPPPRLWFVVAALPAASVATREYWQGVLGGRAVAIVTVTHTTRQLVR